jgi:hypothetical protein
MAEIEAGNGQSDEYFEAKVKVLQEQIEHHIKEEESGKDSIFSQVRAADIDLKALGEQMAARKAELMTEFAATGLPKPELATMTETTV